MSIFPVDNSVKQEKETDTARQTEGQTIHLDKIFFTFKNLTHTNTLIHIIIKN